MSLSEVQLQLENLAKSVAEKNQQLEALKAEYARKLDVVNGYIQSLPQFDPTGTTSEQEFTRLLSQSQASRCPHCDRDIHGQGESEFILIPKRVVVGSSVYEQGSHTTTVPNSTTTPVPTTHRSSKNKHGRNVVCSFCKEVGHTRAKCTTRLGTPKR